MKLAQVLAPAEVGGLERVVQALSTGLAERGHEVLVCPVASGDDPLEPFVRPLRDAAVRIEPVRVPHRHYLRERREVGRILSAFEPDVAHFHGARVDVVDSGAARSLDLPTVTTVHGFTGGGWKNRLYETIQRWAFRRYDAVVAVSSPQRARLLGSGVPDRTLVTIPNAHPPVKDPVPASDARRRLAVPEDAFHVGWVGRLSHEKGPDVFLDALFQLGEDVPCVVSVVGDGPARNDLERRAHELDPVCEVRWHGTVPDAGRLFSAFDLFVLSSRTEGTPMVIFEAMAAGVPIVSARVGGIPDVLTEEEALLVPPERPEALASAICTVADRPDRARRRAARARQTLNEHHGTDGWLDRYEALYSKLAGTRERRPMS